MRVLIAGAPTWIWHQPILDALTEHYERAVAAGESLVVAMGSGVTGADRIVRNWATEAARLGWAVSLESFPADRSGQGSPRACDQRTAAMIAAGADACLAFIVDPWLDAGRRARAAEQAGIPTRYYRQEG